MTTSGERLASTPWRLYAGYVVMIALTVGAFFVIRHFGEGLTGGAAAEAPAPAGSPSKPPPLSIFHLLLALAAVIAAGRSLGVVFRWIGQPPVIAEVIAGILLGPSLLGWISPAAQEFILPTSVAPALSVIAQLGVILYMFIVGLELDVGLLRERGHSTVAISHASIVVPFLLGALLALGMYRAFTLPDVSFTIFALFLGAAMSVTAFPVLARILTDRKMTRTRLGVIAITCAAVDDASAWCLLALVVGVAKSNVNEAVTTTVLTIGYIAIMFLLVRPLVHRWCKWLGDKPPSAEVLAIIFVAVLASALITEWIGVHAIFGAFLVGAIFPHDSAIARDITKKLENLVTVLLLPAFFAYTGMRTRIGLIDGWENWLWCLAIIGVATAGKFGGSFAAARLTGLSWRDSAGLGILMNTRGLMELIVLNIGLELKIISPTVFAMMVIMAIVTTMATTPILQLIGVQEQENGIEGAAKGAIA
jgi:Kef-type K+ transport system membrane component KefB